MGSGFSHNLVGQAVYLFNLIKYTHVSLEFLEDDRVEGFYIHFGDESLLFSLGFIRRAGQAIQRGVKMKKVPAQNIQSSEKYAKSASGLSQL